MDLAKGLVLEDQPTAEVLDIAVRSYTTIGSVRGMGTIEVEAREAVLIAQRHVSHFVRLNVSTLGDYAQTGSASFLIDEVDAVVAGITKLSQATINRTRFWFTEIEYKKDEFCITVFNNAKGALMAAVSTGSVTMHLNALSQLSELSALIIRAKQMLENNQPARP
jgi:hypothetical protein